MIKVGLFLVFFGLLVHTFSQAQEIKGVYTKEKGYKGPENWSSNYPQELQNAKGGVVESADGEAGVPISDDAIQKTRRNQNRSQGNQNGTAKVKVKEPEPIELPEINPPDIDGPDIDINPPDIDLPEVSVQFWRTLLYLLLGIGILAALYFLLKHQKPSKKKLTYDQEEDWNPTLTHKTELDHRLAHFIAEEKYREAIRVYFTLILKALIQKNAIQWQQEKTNLNYVLEMRGKNGSVEFEKCVYHFDLIWYGDYALNRAEFHHIEPLFQQFYQDLIES